MMKVKIESRTIRVSAPFAALFFIGAIIVGIAEWKGWF